MNKGLIIILDGLGDRPNPALDGRTALEAADTPLMDNMIRQGCCGLVDPLYPGVPVDTHTGCGALMGIVPADVRQLSRGTVEAAGVGLVTAPGDVVIRVNFATLEDDGVGIIDRRAGRISEGVAELCQALQHIKVHRDVNASVYPASHHRSVLHLSGSDLSSAVTDSDPGSSVVDSQVLACRAIDSANERAVYTANILNEFSHRAMEILAQHPVNQERISMDKLPANGLLMRGAGTALDVRNLITHLDLKAAVISGEKTLHGLGKLSGFSVIQQPGFTGMPDTDIVGKFQAAKQALDSHDLVYVHIKAPDIFSHSLDALGKMKFLEQVDKALHVLSDIDCVLGISADHSTDSNTGRHCGDPVPSLLLSPNGRVDGETVFGEAACAGGGLGRITAHGFLLSVLDAMERVPNYHPSDAAFIG